MKLLKRLAWIFAVTVVVIAGAIVWMLAGTDYTRFARRVETALEAATGREIVIKGRIEADLLTLDPEIVLNDVRIAGKSSSLPAETGRIRRIHVELRLLPLFAGLLRIERLVLEEPTVRIDGGDKGQVDWPVALGGAKTPYAGLARLHVKSVYVEGGRIAYRGAGARKDTEIRLGRLTISTDGGADPLRLTATGSLDGRWFRLTMFAKSAAALVSGNDTPVRFDALSKGGDLSGRLTVRLGDTTSVTGSLASSRIELRTGGSGVEGPWFLSDSASLPLNLLRRTSVVLSVRATRVRLDAVDLAQVRASISLRGAILKVRLEAARLAQGRLAGTFQLDAASAPPRISVNLSLSGANLATAMVTDRRITGRLDASLAASAKGNTMAAIAADLREAALTVSVKNLAFGKARKGSGPHLLRVKSLSASLDVSALLSGALHATKLTAVEPDIRIETDESGRSNWQTAVAPWRKSKGAAVVPAINKIRIVRGRIIYSGHAGKQPYRVRLDRFDALGAPGKPYRFEASGSVDGKRIGIKGTVDKLSAFISGRPSKLTFTAQLGKSDLSGKLNVRLRDRFQLRGTLASDRLDLGDPTPQGRPGTLLLSEDPLPVGLLRSWSGQVSYRAKTLLMGLLQVSELSASATLADGRLVVGRVTGTVAEGKLTGRAVLDARSGPPRMDLAIDVDRAVVADTLGATRLRVRPDDLLDLSVRASGQGASLRALAATLDGSTVLVLGSGRVSETAGVFTDLGSGMLKAVTAFATGRGGSVRCAAFRVRFRKGMGRSEIMLIDTERMTFVGSGTVNLKTQTVNALFYPRSKVPLARRLSPFTVRFQGPIQSPSAKVDLGAAAAKSAVNIIGLLKLPIDLSKFLFGGKSADLPGFDPCPSAITRARGAAPASRPDR